MKKIAAIIVLTILFSFVSNLYAKDYKMVFWYPGEAGNTRDAEPVLAQFFEYINKKLKGDSISGKYFNSVSEGLAYIKDRKPQLGIVSWVSLKENEGQLPTFTVIAQTLPLPLGNRTDQFTLVGYKPAKAGNWAPPEGLKIYSSIPMGMEFLRSNLVPDIKGGSTIEPTRAMLMTLKKISQDAKSNEAALLTPMEKYTFDNMKGDWKGNISTLYKCKEIPTAPLISFGGKPAVADAFLKALAEMKTDPKGKEILETLRLKGFE